MTHVDPLGSSSDPSKDPIVHTPDLPWTGAVEFWRGLSATQKSFWRTCACWAGMLAALHSFAVVASTVQARLMMGGSWWHATFYFAEAAAMVTLWQISIWWQAMHPVRPPIRHVVGILLLTMGLKIVWLSFIYVLAIPGALFFDLNVWQMIWDVVTVGLVIVGLQLIRPLFGFEFIRAGTREIIDVRTRWSLQGMFWVTAIAALLFAISRSTIASWQNSDVILYVPPVPWMLAMAALHWIRLVVLLIGAAYFAVLQSQQKRLAAALVAILVAVVFARGAEQVFAHWFDGSGTAGSTFLFTPIWLHLLMGAFIVAGHVWFLRRYLKAGYWLQVHSVVHASPLIRSQR